MSPTFYKRSMRRRFYSWLDDISFWYDRNKEGLAGGFLLGLLAGAVMAEFFLGL